MSRLSDEGRTFVDEMKHKIAAGEVRYDDLTSMTHEERMASIAEGCGAEFYLSSEAIHDDAEYEELLRSMLHQRVEPGPK